MKRLKIFMSWIITLLFFGTAWAQQKNTYDQHKVFDETFLNQPGTIYRSGNGAPGPDYWQNRADYVIAVKLDTTQNSINGSDEITYTNNSPNKLHYIWLQLDQNAFKKDSRGSAVTPIGGNRFGRGGIKDGGYQLSSVKIELNGHRYKADYIVSDTRMQIRLPKALSAKGGRMKIYIDYSFKIPRYGLDRMGMTPTKNGTIYQIAQWYPRMCVYDDVRGWDTLPYLGQGEFYLEYGDLDYKVTVPWNMFVAGAGTLENPRDVLTKEEMKRLDRAKRSDKTVFIHKKDEIGQKSMRPVDHGYLTWHFHLNNARDVSWAASNAFIWDAARINLPSGKTILAESFYPEEVDNQHAWARATQYVKSTIQSDSKMWFEYPYPSSVNVAGSVHGMEYPGIVFCDWKRTDARLWGDITHELGHTWFPMIVGSNERRYAWMDEGFNTFIDIFSTRAFNHDEFGNYSVRSDSARYMDAYLLDPDADPIMTQPDVIQPGNLGYAAYDKPALGLYMLRQYIIGPKRFDYAFRTYIRHWAYKHPTPKDFFRTMNSAAGEDLNWFWKEWFYKNWKLDQAVKNVKYVNGKPSEGAVITITNNDRMVMPVKIKVVESDGHTGIKKLPVEIWQRGGTWSFRYDSTSPIDSVIVDPDNQMPDVNPRNNIWTSGISIH